jgi:muramoyltetrapeptide carboxypeptidase
MESKRNRVRALVAGDRIAVVAPSGPVDSEALEAGVAVLEGAGFVVQGPLERPSWRIFSGTDEERLGELQAALDAPDIGAVWLARGGYGLNRILPRLRLSNRVAREKLVIGFSDATALLTAVEAAGGRAIHGPMVAHDLVREAASGGLAHLLDLTGGGDWSVPIPTVFRSGDAFGPVRGGCLTVLASLLGTPAAPVFGGSIALLEDHHEAPQRRVDRLLIQLRQSGAIDGVRGFVFGVMDGCGPPAELRETILDCLGDLEVPIGFGAPVGHGAANLAVPLGLEANLSLSAAHGGHLSGRKDVVAG